MDVASWNVLHDGRIIAAEVRAPGELRLTIEIEYLCGYLPTNLEYLFVTLTEFERIEYKPFETAPVTEPTAIAALNLELLSAGYALHGDDLSVECADGSYGGQLLLRYGAAHFATGEGVPSTQTEVESASENYWTEWQKRASSP